MYYILYKHISLSKGNESESIVHYQLTYCTFFLVKKSLLHSLYMSFILDKEYLLKNEVPTLEQGNLTLYVIIIKKTIFIYLLFYN